jgi:serine/threonine-protein kinase
VALLDSSGAVVGEQRRRLALLTLLAAAGERGVSRDLLMSRLSPESDASSARHALHQLLYYLRRQAGEQVFLGTDPLRLNLGIVSSDLAEFEAALEHGALTEAVALYRGPFLDGFHLVDSAEFEEWVAAERSRLAARHAEAIAALAAEADAAGDHPRAIEWWSRLVALDPLSGRAAVGLMQALAGAGDNAGALRQAQLHQARVRAELGVGVAAQVAELAEKLQQAGRPIPEPDRFGAEGMRTDVAVAGPARDIRAGGRRRLLLAGTLGGALTIAGAAVLGLGRSGAVPSGLDPHAVAVLPFRVESSDSSLAWLGTGMVELLTIRLAGDGGIALADPGRVLPAWRQAVEAAEATGKDPLPDLAMRLEAGRLVQGSVMGDTDHVVLTASLRPAGERGDIVRALVEGDSDSIPVLIDRLAAQLLGLGAGVERFRLASLTSASLPAIRAFLAGREHSRLGRSERAVQEFREAVRLDSTFALAALELYRSWSATDEDRVLGARLAHAGRERLGGPDRALLDAMLGQFLDRHDLFEKWRAAVSAYPDRPETWYGLGDAYFHWGLLAGIEDPLRRAEEAFRRGWELDAATQGTAGGGLVVEPLEHMVELAHLRRDTVEVRRLTAHVVAADSANERARALEWHRATFEPEPVRRAYWSSLGAGSTGTLFGIANFIAWTGEGSEDYGEAVERLMRRLRTVGIDNSGSMLPIYALNGGRPSEAETTTDGRGGGDHAGLRDQLRRALWWDGDTAAAIEAARELRRSADGPLASGVAARRIQYEDMCALGLWRAARGELDAARPAVGRLRAARVTGLHGGDSASAEHFPRFCAELLDAAIASGEQRAASRASIAGADSLAREFIFEVCCGEAVVEANLLLARLWEREGDLPRALGAVRRRAGGFLIAPMFLSTFVREEGRLAGLSGDTAGAIRAYRHYLVLRSDPDRALRPQRDSVRAELERLAGSSAVPD